MKLAAALLLAVSPLGCGQMYQSPGGANNQPSPTEPAPDYGAPPPGQGAPGADSGQPPPSGQQPSDPYGAPPPQSSGQPPQQKQASTGNAMADQFVLAHNRVRAKHCAPPLTWSPKLAAVAQAWAESLKNAGCKFEHSKNPYGENLAAGTSGTLPPEAVVDMWYAEVAKYKFPDGGFAMETGHFTQVVWRATTEVGCGVAQCNGMDLWVCNYSPYGNVQGQYRTQVLPEGCK